MENAGELVFIPGPGMGHLVAAVEMGKLLVNRDQRISITYLIIDLPFDTGINAYTNSLSASSSRLSFIHFPPPEKNINPDEDKPANLVTLELISSQKPKVRDVIKELMISSVSGIACMILDMFCMSMMDVGEELGLPSYVFFTSSAAFLGFQFEYVRLKDEENVDIVEYKDSDAELVVSTFTSLVPAKVLPSIMLDKMGAELIRSCCRKIPEAKGVMVNTFLELEQFAVKSLSMGKNPPVYPIGPVINLASQNQTKESADHEIMSFLDNHPPSSVVFLCFGSLGWFPEDQVKEIAYALERIRCPFLWSLKRPPAAGNLDAPNGYLNPEKVLPRGFLERTSSVGKVIGTAPQMAVLSHPSVGGFVSHCGWNSILESLWFGVPIAAWPSYAEQQINTFEMVVELGLAVDIRMDYRIENCKNTIVGADEIESSIRRLMVVDSEQRRKVKELQDQSRKTLMNCGSSYNNLGNLIKDILGE